MLDQRLSLHNPFEDLVILNLLCYSTVLIRTFSNSVLAALIVAALFWGNCFSCPQLLLSLAQKAPHGCCKRPPPVTRTCTTDVLRHFVKADPVAVTAPVAAPAEDPAFVPASTARDLPVTFETLHSPPDLLIATSLLRI